MDKRKIFLIAQSVLCVLIAVLLCAAAVRIFREGSALQAAGHLDEWIYTREKVAAALSPILPLILVSLAMTVYGTVRGIGKREAEKPVRDAELTRDFLCSRVGSPSAEMKKERELQKKLQIVGRAVFGICMIPILLYLLNENHFAMKDPAGLESAVLLLTAYMIPWTAAGLAALCFSAIAMEKSMLRETDVALVRIKEEKASGDTSCENNSCEKTAHGNTAPDNGSRGNAAHENISCENTSSGNTAPENSSCGNAAHENTAPQKTVSDPDFNKIGPARARRRVLIRRVLLAAAICFTVMGIFNGSMRGVLVKAIRICTECIGLG